eukprot:3315518-Karenia_brevis.AAC.1
MMLYAKSLSELVYMTETLIHELDHIGLSMNAKKTKILSNDLDHTIDDNGAFIEIAGELIEILPWNADHKYLGRKINI